MTTAFSPEPSNDFESKASPFVGRERELQWLEEHIAERRDQSVVVISGLGGTGKTALVQNWYRTRSRSRTLGWLSTTPLWFDAENHVDPAVGLAAFVEEVYAERSSALAKTRNWVVLDGADALTYEQMRSSIRGLLNLKRIHTVVIICRRSIVFRGASYLRLRHLPQADAIDLLSRLLERPVPSEEILSTALISEGSPLAIKMLAALLNSGGENRIEKLLSRPLYEAPQLVLPEPKLITTVAPKIITANEALIERLRDNPVDLFDLHPRRLEEVVAELFSAMGARVELTSTTRDGGRDILLFWTIAGSELLCLVDTKRYRPDRKVTVGMVRTLYGTFTHYQANHAMLVTTSSFTKDAHEFREDHKYQLDLKEYSHIVGWLRNYKKTDG